MKYTAFPARIPAVTAISVIACVAALFSTSSAPASTPIARAKSMVLTRHDVGRGFTQQHQSFTPAQLARQGTWTLDQLRAWGYRGGYERVFDRDLHTVKGRQIASNASVFRTAAGATQSLIANGNQCTVGTWQVLPAPKDLGDQAVFCTRTGTADGLQGQLFFLVWRVGRTKGSISLSGEVNHVNAAKAVALARRQAVKM